MCIATYQGVKHRARLISTGIRCGAPTDPNPISLLARFRRRTFGVHSRPRVAPGRVNAIYKFMKCIGMDSQSKRRCAFPCTALVGSRPVFFFIGACRCRLSVHKFDAEVCSSMWCWWEDFMYYRVCFFFHLFPSSLSLLPSVSLSVSLPLCFTVLLSLYLSVNFPHPVFLHFSLSYSVSPILIASFWSVYVCLLLFLLCFF